MSVPPCRILLRSKQRLELCTLPSPSSSSGEVTSNEQDGDCSTPSPGSKTVLLDQCATTLQSMTPDGSAVYVVVSGKGVVKCSLLHPEQQNDPEPFLADTAGVQMLDVSPTGAFLLTWERLKADSCPKNLKVWSAATGALLAAWPQKAISRESWPYLQWTTDEAYAFLLSGNQVRVYAASDLLNSNATEEPRFTDKVQVLGCTTLSLPQLALPIGSTTTPPRSSRSVYYLTTFSPKTKSQPGCASIYEWSAASKTFNRLAVKSLFQAESCTTYWSPTSSTTLPACLLTLQTAVDTSGESYYGSSQLLLWNTETKNEVLSVPLPQEGPVQAVAWMPHPEKPASFVAVAGKMPAMASQHHGVTGQVTFLFGNNVHRNTVAPSPHGRFLCLAGLGNLAGGMGFWDVNKKKLLPHCPLNASGTLRAEAVTMHSWAPDSRHFLAATTAPRMNVDNGVRLFKYTGEPVVLAGAQQLPWNNNDYLPNLLLEACFVPALYGVYPDRPQSPIPERRSGDEAAATAATIPTSTTAAAAKPPSVAGRYVPPSARNRAGGSSLAERLRREKEGQLQGATTVVKNKPLAAVSATGRVIPGLTVASAAGKSKTQMKREKMKKKKEQQQEEEEQEQQQPAVHEATNGEPVDPEKRARKIKKLLKQIDELKQRSGTDLNDEQKAKVASEAELRAELEQLAL